MSRYRRRQLTVRMDPDLYEAVERHREAMRERTPQDIEVPMRAAVESLLRAGLRSPEPQAET